MTLAPATCERCGAVQPPPSEDGLTAGCRVCEVEGTVVQAMGRHLWRRVAVIPVVCLLGTGGLCLPVLDGLIPLGLGYLALSWSREALKVARQMHGCERDYGGGDGLRRALRISGSCGGLWSIALMVAGTFLVALQLVLWSRALLSSFVEVPPG